jgi:RHS repeat-associated protein
VEPSNGFIGDSPITYLSPGSLTFRSTPDSGNSYSVACTGGQLAGLNIINPGGYTLTRLTWTGADGTETELVDLATGGQEQSQPYGCNGAGNGQPLGTAQPRGTVFVATDGSAITFISSSTIYDPMEYADLSGPVTTTTGTGIAGWLFFPDGARYTIMSGDVSQIRDRNGNQVNICEGGWSGCTGYSATDPLSRITSFTYASFPNGATVASDTIAFTGFNGASRTVTVNYGQLSSYLAPGQNLQTYGCLFPDLTNGSTQTDFNPYVTTSIVLPNNQSYSFLYTSYGEVAQVTLPTGGVIQYEYGGMVPNPSGSYSGAAQISTGTCGSGADGVISLTTIERRLLVRKVLPAGVSGPVEQWTTYAFAAGGTPQSNSTVTVQHLNSAGTALSQEQHYYYQNPAYEQFADASPTHYTPWQEGREYQTNFLDGSGNLLRSVANTWIQRPCPDYASDAPCWFTGTTAASPNMPTTYNGPTAPAHYPALSETDTTLSDSGQVSSLTYLYDQYNNRTDTYEYDYGGSPLSGTLLRHTNRTFLTRGYDVINTSNPSASIHLRDLPSTELVTDGSGNTSSQTNIFYDQTALTDYGPLANHDSGYGASYTTRGNATGKQSFISGSASITQQSAYDTLGNVLTATDGNGNNTYITFTSPDYALPKTISKTASGKTLTWSKSYDLSSSQVYTGQVTGFTDPNNNTTAYSDLSDPLDRLSLVTLPTTGRTQFLYNDVSQTITTETDQVTAGDAKVVSETLFDGFGRQIQSRAFEDSNPSGTNYISTEQTFDALGRQYQASLPHRQNAATHWSTTTYDALSRVIGAATDDGSTTRSSYSGNVTTVTDPAGNLRASTTDAAGRLTAVTEAGSVTTNYHYSASDDLLAVCQAGSFGANYSCTSGEGRQFTYDWLSRLTSATNPESGTMQYSQYDNNGNLLSKTDARSVTTTVTYDALNRPLSKSYSGGAAPSVTYCYDGTAATTGGGGCTSASPAIPNPLGHLTQEYSSASVTTYTAFDGMGHVTASSQLTGGTTYAFGAAASPGYAYNLSGQLTSETYPSGRQVTYDFDAAGRTAHVKNPATGGVTYADLSLFNPGGNQYGYAPNGGIQTMTLGNAVVENWSWDPIRLMPTQTQIGSLLTLNYYYCPSGGTSCSSNNGNMLGQSITTPTLGTVTQNYSYTDGFNRLTSAAETNAQSQQTWQQTFQYDSYGNRALTSGYTQYPALTPGSLTAFNGSNQWTGAGYDAGGNTTSVPQQTFTYDAENRLTASTQQGTPAISYAYDGDGRRVQKTVGGSVSTYVYDASSQLAAEYGTPTDTGTTYVSVDHLGSTRLLQRSAGLQHYDYLPFGEDLPQGIGGRDGTYAPGIYPTSPDYESAKFTGKERDAETGLDFFQARYISGVLGRFASPDPIFVTQFRVNDPQQWNRYAYARNNPLRFTDPTGLDIWLQGCGDESDTCHGGYVGGYNDNGEFERTHLSGDLTDSATVGTSGIGVNYNGGTYQGVWDTNKDEQNAVTVGGSGTLSDFTFTINGNCGGTCAASGFVNGTDTNSGLNALQFAVASPGSGFLRNPGLYGIDPWHKGAVNFLGYDPNQPQGLPATHLPVPGSLKLAPDGQPIDVDFHIDARYPFEDATGFANHAGSIVHTLFNDVRSIFSGLVRSR